MEVSGEVDAWLQTPQLDGVVVLLECPIVDFGFYNEFFSKTCTSNADSRLSLLGI